MAGFRQFFRLLRASKDLAGATAAAPEIAPLRRTTSCDLQLTGRHHPRETGELFPPGHGAFVRHADDATRGKLHFATSDPIQATRCVNGRRFTITRVAPRPARSTVYLLTRFVFIFFLYAP